jgi:tape measure domain-containing protein
MDNKRELEIVLKARDEASRTIKEVGNTTTGVSKLIQDHYKEAAVAATGLIASLGAITKSAVENAASYEQNRIAFESMLGSGDKARTLLKQISEFAMKTPFELPEVVEGSKRLLAYNIEAEKLIPTFRMLGDISSAVGRDKLPQLILAFGQVKAATKLTGAELRQFSEAGVPLLDALVKQANAAGGSWVTVGGAAKKSKVDVGELNDKLAIARQRLDEATKSGKAKESTLMNLRNTIQNYEQKISSASQATEGASRVFVKTKVSAADMMERISDGEVTFAMVEKALGGMTSQGGKFFNMMERQSKTFDGVISNIRDTFGKFAREVVGISESGDIREGSLFATLKNGAEQLLVTLERLRPQVTAMVNAFSQNETAVAAVAGAIGGLLVLAIGAAVIAFGPAIAVMLGFAAAGATIAGTITYLNTTFDLFKTRQDMITEAQRQAKDAVDAHWQAVRNLDDAIKGLTNAELNLEGAQLRYERAQRTLADVTRQYGANTLEAKEARHNLKRAEDDVATAMAEVNKKMDAAQKKYDEGIKKADEVIAAQDNVTAAVNRQRTAWDSVKEAIQSAFNKAREWDLLGKSGPGGAGASALLSNLPRFANGGWVPNTGLAVVHQGEYVLSRDMLAGRQRIEAPITNNRNSNITMNNHFHTDVSPDQVIRQLSFALKFDSTI